MRSFVFVTSALLFGLSAGCTVSCPTPPASAAPANSTAPTTTAANISATHNADHDPPRHVYRLDFVVTGATAGAAPTQLSMNLEEGKSGELHSGANVPLTPGNARIDVGLKVKAFYFIAPGTDDLLVDTVIEMSSTEEPVGVHKLTATGQTLAAPGKPALIASIDDPAGKRHVSVTVAPTKLR